MFFFFKKQEIVLDCFTHLPQVYEYAKIDYANKFIPEWWKETKGVIQPDTLTIKRCQGFIDFYKTGIIIPSWFELDLTLTKNTDLKSMKLVSSCDDLSTTGSHHYKQFELFSNNGNRQNIKLQSPWHLKTKENLNFTWSAPIWNSQDTMFNLALLPAVVNYRYQHSTNINYLFERRDIEQKIKIMPQTPLVMLHPHTDKNIVIKNHLVSLEKFMNVNEGIYQMFFNSSLEQKANVYNKKKKIIDQMDEREPKKCPFH
jgi:hypothetical protein